MVVIRFASPKGTWDLLRMISDSFMSRANTIVVPGHRMLELAMQLIFTPFIAHDGAPAAKALGRT